MLYSLTFRNKIQYNKVKLYSLAASDSFHLNMNFIMCYQDLSFQKKEGGNIFQTTITNGTSVIVYSILNLTKHNVLNRSYCKNKKHEINLCSHGCKGD